MTRLDRLIVLAVLVVITSWRVIRFMRLGMNKRTVSLGVAGGSYAPGLTPAAKVAPASTAQAGHHSILLRVIDVLVTLGIWLIGNVLIWYCLLEVPWFASVPAIVLGVVGIFANFYLIPFARRGGKSCTERILNARAAKGSLQL